MIQKKICLLGAFSVGKTSLIQRYVSSLFSEQYLTTVGVKVDKKTVHVDDQDVMMMIWDLAGEDDYNRLQTSYLRGSSGYILVADGTRPNTVQTLLDIAARTRDVLGDVPCIAALNKADLEAEWLLDEAALQSIETGFTSFRTSAKTGQNVEAVFEALARAML